MIQHVLYYTTLTAAAFVIAYAPSSTETPPPPTPLPICTESEIQAALDALPAYQPSETRDFVRVKDSRFVIDESIFAVRGVNYYPSRYPWRRFLTGADLQAVETELDLMRGANLNTLRIFLWNQALFTCPGSGAVPVADAFMRLDIMIQQAAARDFRLIVTLNDLPDLTDYPLYTNPPHIQAQTRFIVERYRDEAAILAWDVRNEGDIDYGSHDLMKAKVPRDVVLAWLDQTTQWVRLLDSNHLITAGWLYDNESTIPYVDFVSFHHWIGAPEARERIVNLQYATGKPILLEEFGYSTMRYDLETQANTIGEVIRATEEEGAAGWLIWTAFDFPTDATCIEPNCPSQDNAEHHFGIWYADYTPKPAVEVVAGS